MRRIPEMTVGARRHDPGVLGALAGAPLFRGLPMTAVARLLDQFAEERFPAGQRIVTERLRGQEFFLIVAGRVVISHHGWPDIEAGPGEGFGEVGLFAGGERLATVVSATDLRCLVLPNRRLLDLLLAEPRLTLNLAGQMVARFRRLSEAAGRGGRTPG